MDTNDPKWQKLMSEILSGMKEWREQHPQAKFAEIERETMKRMAEIQARMLEELAQMSETRDWEAERPPECPECGAPMEKRGQQKRELQAAGGEGVNLERSYAVCPKCGAGIFPPG